MCHFTAVRTNTSNINPCCLLFSNYENIVSSFFWHNESRKTGNLSVADRICSSGAVRVRTHQQSRVQSNPVQSDSRRRGSHSVAYLQWQPQQCVHTNRVESSRVESYESCRVMSLDSACSTFVSQILVIVRDGCHLEEEKDVEKLFFF